MNFAHSDVASTRLVGNIEGEMMFAPGLPMMLAFAMLLFALLWKKPNPQSKFTQKGGVLLLLATVISLWVPTLLFPWRYVQNLPVIGGVLATLQFPWRFLIITTLLLALCGGALVLVIGFPKTRRVQAVTLAALFVLCTLAPTYIYDQRLDSYDVKQKNAQIPLQYDSDMLYLYPDPDATRSTIFALPNNIRSDASFLEVTNLNKNGTHLRFNYTAENASWLEVPLMWYPGYVTRDQDGNAIPTQRSTNGLMRLLPSQPQGAVSVHYAGLWWFRVGDIISLLTLAGAIVWKVLKRTKKQKYATNQV